MLERTKIFIVASFLATSPTLAKHHHLNDDDQDSVSGLADVTLLVVTHAEKPVDEGNTGLALSNGVQN